MKCAHCGQEIKPGEIIVSGGFMNFAKFHFACKAVYDLVVANKERTGKKINLTPDN